MPVDILKHLPERSIMTKIGQLKTDKPIESAIREIKEWLSKIDINGLETVIRRKNVCLYYLLKSQSRRNSLLNSTKFYCR